MAINNVSISNVEYVVSLPLSFPVVIRRNQTIGEAEISFMRKRDAEVSHAKKVELDRVRALLKWGEACNANLVEIHQVGHEVKITLEFTTPQDLIEFTKGFE